MIDDCRYPEGMIAPPYFERPMSILPVSTGSMPGAIPKPEYFDILPSGRGVISGTTKFQEVPLGLVESRKYPDYDTYYGEAFEATLQFHSPRLAFLNDWIEKISTSYVERTTLNNGAEMLSLNIWVTLDRFENFNTYNWKIKWTFYIPSTARLGVATASATATAIIAGVFALLLAIILYLIVKQVTTIIHGYPPGEYPPGEKPKPLWSYIPWAVLGIGIIVIAPMITGKTTTKKRGKKK